jgi:hypothetical protein
MAYFTGSTEEEAKPRFKQHGSKKGEERREDKIDQVFIIVTAQRWYSFRMTSCDVIKTPFSTWKK